MLVSVSAQFRPLRAHDTGSFIIVIVIVTSAPSSPTPVVVVGPESRELPIRHVSNWRWEYYNGWEFYVTNIESVGYIITEVVAR